MNSRPEHTTKANEALLREWRLLHPEFTDAEFAEALRELRVYLRFAWTVYRQQHPDLDLPGTL